MLLKPTRRTLLRGAAAALALPAYLRAAHAQTVIKVAGIHNSPVENAWNSRVHAAFQSAAADGLIEYSFSEAVAATDYPRAMREYAEGGAQLIWGESFAVEAEARAVAADYPETAFLMGSSGAPEGANFGVFGTRNHEAAYLAGMLAGKMSATNVFGSVGGYPIPEVNLLINAFRLGVAEVNPEATFLNGFIGAWFDPAKAKEAALAQIDAGADILFGERIGTADAAQERGVKAIGSLIDYTPRYPGTVFANAIWNYRPTIDAIVADITAGTPVGRDYTEYSFMKYGGNELIYVAAEVPADRHPGDGGQAGRHRGGRIRGAHRRERARLTGGAGRLVPRQHHPGGSRRRGHCVAGRAMTGPVLELDAICKRFGDLVANDSVSLHLNPGEILALLGENGAGKTTLMNILFGHYTADSGVVRVQGRALPPGQPRAAIAAGVGMVHQHFTLAGNLTVLDNILIGTEPLFRLTSRRAQARARVMDLSQRFGLPVEPAARVADLSVGERQRVEILKALYRDARILILDEPTAVLARPEAEHLFATLRGMTGQGLSIIFISHKLHEVMAASDRVSVLRGGRHVADRATSATSPGELAELMVGRAVTRPRRQAHGTGAPVLVARGLSAQGRGAALDTVDFEVRQGEILGIVGVSGNGQAMLGQVLSGLARPTAGSLTLDGRDLTRLTPRAAVGLGMGRIPEDRHAEGTVGDLAVWENAVLERLREPGFSRLGFVRRRAAQAHAADLIARYDIRGAGPDTRTRLLSGGNMQKLILGRNLARAPRFLLANQPTRGLDEGAIAAVHADLLAARAAGAAILLISEDLDEAVGLSDRLQAIVKGRLSAPIPAEQADAQRLGLMMAGVWEPRHAV